MAPVLWTNLPPDILQSISNILNSDVDLLRLRSVCSSWRASLPLQTPNPFPLQVAPLLTHPKSQTVRFYFKHSYPSLPSGDHFFLKYTTLYRLSPPQNAPNYSHGWLFRVSHSNPNPNTFSFLTPLLPDRFKCNPRLLPQRLNLLDYSITEICRCYHLEFVDDKGVVTSLSDVLRKVIVLRNFVAGCDFAVLVLVSNKDMRYWKFGDKDWIYVDTGKYDFDDVILFNGKLYAICAEGVLASFDSEFNMNVESEYNYDLVSNYNNFVVYQSKLFVVSKIYDWVADEMSSDYEGPYVRADSYHSEEEDEDDSCSVNEEDADVDEVERVPVVISLKVKDEVTLLQKPCVHNEDDVTPGYDRDGDEDELASCFGGGSDGDEFEDEDEDSDENDSSDDNEEQDSDENDSSNDNERAIEVEPYPVEILVRIKVFEFGDGLWCHSSLEDKDIFLSSDDVSVGVSTKDFGHCKGNCVYLAHKHFFDDDMGIRSSDHHGVYDFNYKHKTKSLILNWARGYAKLYWPPPAWLRE